MPPRIRAPQIRALTLAAVSLLAIGCASPAKPPETAALAAPQPAKPAPAGDWNGTLVVPQQTYHLGIHIDEAAPGQFTGTIGSHETGRWGTALSDVALADNSLAFRVPSTNASFTGAWDAATTAWIGTYKNATGSFPLTLKAGMVPPLPVIAGMDGRWEGVLTVQGIKLRLVLRVTTDEHGTAMLMDSPDQMANGIRGSNITRTAAAVAFDIPAIKGHYAGELSVEGATLTGEWTQGPAALPLIFTHTSTDAALIEPKRPQTPQPPFPYKTEDVAYDNPLAPGVRLACTLTTPPTSGRHPAAILITGSGAQDRDETLLGHHVFGVLADHLTRHGIAVLRCDDRGFGKSTGVFATAFADDFATDVRAGLAFLRTRADIDPKRIGLIGHSEGSITGPLAMADDPGVAFLVMMGGVGVKGIDVMTEQRTLIFAAMGAKPETLAAARASTRAVFEAAVAAPDDAAATEAVTRLLLASGDPSINEETAKSAAAQFTAPYMRKLLAYDPAPALSKVKVPVLAITGSRDLQVPANIDFPGIRAAMPNNKDLTMLEIPNLNHIFQTTQNGAPAEYAENEETFAPVALDAITSWIVKRMKP